MAPYFLQISAIPTLFPTLPEKNPTWLAALNDLKVGEGAREGFRFLAIQSAYFPLDVRSLIRSG